MHPEQFGAVIVPVVGLLFSLIMSALASRYKQPIPATTSFGATGPLDTSTSSLIAQLREQLADQRTDILTLRAEMAQIRTSYDGRIDGLQKAYDAKIESLIKTNELLKDEIKRLEMTRLTLNGRVDALENERDSLLAKNEEQRQEISDLRREIETLRTQVNRT